jgi:hypothetical protein
MTEEGREVDQTSTDIDPLPIPSQQRSDGEGVAQAVQAWCCDAPGWLEGGVARHEVMKDLRDCARMERAPNIEREHRVIGL